MDISFGVVTGAIGMITGVAGSVMGYTALRHSKKIKIGDRRVEAGQLRNKTLQNIRILQKLITQAVGTKKVTLAARNIEISSGMIHFEAQAESDRSTIRELSKLLPDVKDTLKAFSRVQLEDLLVSLDEVNGKVCEMIADYELSLMNDKSSVK